jgi:hypothetical protein
MGSRYLESPYFTFIVELQPDEERFIDIHTEKPKSQKYGRFNYLIITNQSVADIEILIDDNTEADWIFIPAGSSIIIDNEWFDKLRIKNISPVATDKPVRIAVKRELSERVLLEEIAQKLGALSDLKKKWSLF